ncbi:MAG: hypothetical protein AAFP02_21940, partial [Bacteroidota bacterium]
MLSFLRCALLCLCALVLHLSQAQTHEWSYMIGNTNPEQGRKIATDHLGNIYVTGVFSGTVDFDPGPTLYNRTSNGGQDGYVIKYLPGGQISYVYTFGGVDNDLPIDITVAPNGDVYLVGVFRGFCNFVGATRTSNGQEDAFLLKLDINGSLDWVVAFGGTQN